MLGLTLFIVYNTVCEAPCADCTVLSLFSLMPNCSAGQWSRRTKRFVLWPVN